MSETSIMKDALLAEVRRRLEKHGFTADPRNDQSFSRPAELGTQRLHISFRVLPPEVDVVAEAAIRFDELEDLLNFDSRQPPRVRRQTSRIGGELGYIGTGSRLTWTLRESQDAEGVAREIEDAVVQIAEAFFEELGTYESALARLRENTKDAVHRCPLDHVRAKVCVGLAHLLGRSDDVRTLISTGEAMLSANDDPHLSQFLAFAEYVQKNPHKNPHQG